MKISAEVISHSTANGIDLVTLQLKAPKFLDAEFEKHRMLSSNSSSDRAIPFNKMCDRGYFLPQDVRVNESGMQGSQIMSDEDVAKFHEDLIKLHGYTTDILLSWNKVHKQHLNRYLLGFTWQDKVVTATEWNNFYNLRIHEAADPAMYELARVMKAAQDESVPQELEVGEWHLPYVDWKIMDLISIVNGKEMKLDIEVAKKCSAARCARVSYLKHDKSDPSVEEDIELYNMLVTRPFTDKRGNTFSTDDPIHASPTEHSATPMQEPRGWECIPNKAWMQTDSYKGVTHIDMSGDAWSGNFKGWIQARQLIS